MPIIVALATAKGGTGKTTSALALGHLIGSQDHSVKVVDLDRQASATAWASALADTDHPLAVEVVQPPDNARAARLPRLIADLADGADFVFIDCPPGDMERVDAAIEAVAVAGGIVLVPTSTSQVDLPMCALTVEMVEDRAQVVALLTQTKGGEDERSISLRDARAGLESIGVVVLEATVPERESAKLQLRMTTGSPSTADLYEPVAVDLLALLS